jgi:hypothetical protein
VLYLSRIPRVEWDKKHFRKLKGVKGLWELKWKAEGKEFRVAGYDHYEGYFVMLVGFTHKQDVYDPPGWLEVAKKNLTDAKNGKWDIVQFEA